MYIRTNDGLGQASEPERGSMIPDLPIPDFVKELIPDFVKERAGLKKPDILKKAFAPAQEMVHEAVRHAKAGIPREKICWIQTVLNKTSGENLVPDGLYGPRTRAAVGRFQARSGFSANGLVDPRTNTALIQTSLNQIAQASLLPVDGVMDARVQQEIKRFQLQKSLVPDGVVGPKTRVAMVLALGGRCVATAQPPQVKPHVIINGGGKCNQAEYARLQKHCRDQAIGSIMNCGKRFGVDVSELIPKLLTFAGTAVAFAEVPPVAVIIALLGGLYQYGYGAKYAYELATCIQAVLRAYNNCLSTAKEATGC